MINDCQEKDEQRERRMLDKQLKGQMDSGT